MLYFSSVHPPHLLWKVVCLAYVGFCSPCILMLVSLLWWLLDNLIHKYAIYNIYGIYIYHHPHHYCQRFFSSQKAEIVQYIPKLDTDSFDSGEKSHIY